jgi:hypothetical protein
LLGNIKHYSPQTFERELIEAPAPYNSVKGNITGDDEYVIYNNEQTYISYIVHYKYPALKGWQYSYQCHIAMFKMRNPTADMPLPHHLTSFANFIKHYRPNHVMPSGAMGERNHPRGYGAQPPNTPYTPITTPMRGA